MLRILKGFISTISNSYFQFIPSLKPEVSRNSKEYSYYLTVINSKNGQRVLKDIQKFNIILKIIKLLV